MSLPQSSSRRAATHAALALACALVAVPAGAQLNTPIPLTFFGVNPVHSGDFPPLYFGTVGHPSFVWPAVEPARGTYDFTTYDAFVNDAVARGLVDTSTHTVHMAITLGLTPDWAVANQKTCTHPAPGGLMQCAAPPDSMTDWTDMLTHLVGHYNGSTMPHIQYYELWNEADDANWYKPPAGDTTYSTLVGMARLAYPIVHTDTVSLLLSPSVAGTIDRQASWMAGYLKAGGAPYADVGVYHGYMGANGVVPFPMPEDDGTWGSTITRATRMRTVFDTCGLAGKPMLMTEGSWGSFSVTDPAAQVAWVARYMLLQAGLRSTLNLQLASWFSWADSSFGWGNLETGTGQPNAAAEAYTNVSEWVVGARIASPFSGGVDGTWIGTLTRPGGYVAKAVWNTAGPATWTPPSSEYTRYRDLAGHTFTIAPGATVPIGPEPILAERGTATSDVPPAAAVERPLRAWPSVTAGASRIVFGRVLAAPGRVTIRDVLGRLVRTLPAPAGGTSVTWDGRSDDGRAVGTGLYFLRLVSAGAIASGRVAIVR